MSSASSLIVSPGFASLLKFAVLTTFVAVGPSGARRRPTDAKPNLFRTFGFEAQLGSAAFTSSIVLSPLVPGGVEGFARARALSGHLHA